MTQRTEIEGETAQALDYRDRCIIKPLCDAVLKQVALLSGHSEKTIHEMVAKHHSQTTDISADNLQTAGVFHPLKPGDILSGPERRGYTRPQSIKRGKHEALLMGIFNSRYEIFNDPALLADENTKRADALMCSAIEASKKNLTGFAESYAFIAMPALAAFASVQNATRGR